MHYGTLPGPVMILFFIVFLTIYGGMHWYWCRKLMAVFPSAPAPRTLLAVFCAGMIVTPLSVRLLEQRGAETAARWAAVAGYSWMGFLFLSCSFFLMLDLLRLCAWPARNSGFGKSLTGFYPAPGIAFSGVVTVSVLICGYGWFEANTIHTETVDICTDRISKAAGTITLVQISDVHLGVMVGEKRLSAMLRAVSSASPDLVVATGDLIDGQMDGRDGLCRLLEELRPRLGKFAVTGNHELYAGSRQALSFLRGSGFTVLHGEAASLPAGLTIAGVDDPVFGGKAAVLEQEKKVLLSASSGRFTVLLKHRPVVAPESLGRFDLQLSGHVHQGQIFPFGLLTRLAFPLPTGLSDGGGGSKVYVSRGAGTWGPPIRFLAPPEITVFRFRHPGAVPEAGIK